MRFASHVSRRVAGGLAVVFVAAAATTPLDAAVLPTGIGVAGDSLSDEYRFPIFTGTDRMAARNYVEILAAGFHSTGPLNFGTFTTDALLRGAPRNAGYEFNWAQDGDASTDMLAHGQIAGLAGQIAAHQIDAAVVMIGTNDFRYIFASPDPVPMLVSVPATLATNVATAVGTLLAADPNVKVVVGNVPDPRHTPQLRQALILYPELQPLVDGVTLSINGYNSWLAGNFAGNPRVALVDVHGMLETAMSAGFTIDGLDLYHELFPSTDGRHLFVDPVHPGTAGQSMLANAVVGALNQVGYDIPPLSERDIAMLVPLPDPVGLSLGFFGGTLVLRRVRRSRAA